MRATPMRRVPRLLAATAASAVLLAGCSDGGTDAMTASGEAAMDGPAAPRERAAAPESADSSGGRNAASGSINRTTVQTRAVIRTGRIAVVVQDLERARGEVDAILARHGGYVAEEEASTDRRGELHRARLVLRLPVTDFGTAMTELAELGRKVDAHTESEDVTTEVIDVDTRVAVQRASIDRLQRFLRRATTVEDMIRVEEELARRQAELESLLGQQAYLADRTALSTITVNLSTVPPGPGPEPKDDSGFLAGLKNGWTALTTVLVGLATVAGAVLPFAVALGVVALPLWLLARTIGARRTTVHPTAPAGPPQE